MKIKTVLILLSLSLAIAMSLQSQTVTNTFLNLPQEQANVVFAHQMLESAKLGLLNSNKAAFANSIFDSPVGANIMASKDVYPQIIPPTLGSAYSQQQPSQTVTSQNKFTTEDLAYMQQRGIDPNTFTIVPSITNREGYVIPPEDVAYLRAQGWSDADISNVQVVPKQQQQAALRSTPPELKNALVYVDNFLGSGKTGFPADVISIKKGALKFRFGGKDFDYSGNFSILLITPRQHKNPYFGLGKPETVKLLILEDFFKGDAINTMPLPNATIWEKSEGYIVATGADKEWIHSGTYTIQN